MEQNLKITYYKPDKQGVFPITNGYCFATEVESDEESGVLLYKGCEDPVSVPFSKDGKCGTLFGVRIESDEKQFPFKKYNYYEGKEHFTDSYAKLIEGLQVWGDLKGGKRETYGVLQKADFDWEDDKPLELPTEDTVIYGLNVRAFTMHKSSGVKNKGTFEGIVEKIPHFKKLGITAIELMPAYEYEECMDNESDKLLTMDETVQSYTIDLETQQKRLNCWGFQKGFYFAPKASYCKERPDVSFKKMVKELHRSGIEVIMQFYFPLECKSSYIVEVLKYWVIEYHIDGVRLSGFHIPYTVIAGEPVLKRTKIWGAYFPIDEIYGDKPPVYRNLLSDNGHFRDDMRRYLKGDENLINQVMVYHKNNSEFCCVVNYLADYDGFSLFDLVSYEHKHNEANGEDNRDGTELNYSWNCGVEGESRKKSVVSLRKKQLKNALSFIFLSQGIPYLFSGDEFANTRYGNNNAYCQDNETGYVKWKMNQFSEEIFSFTCDMIKFRREHKLLHTSKELRAMDTLTCGYPDISYHGTEAWRPDTSYISRMVGIMLYGKYVTGKEENSLYIAYNMHWEKHELALPKLPKGKKWIKIMSTAEGEEKEISISESKILVEARSVALYCSETDEFAVKGKASKKVKKDVDKK